MRKIQFSNVFFDSEPFYQQILDPGTGGIARIPGREGEQTTLGALAEGGRFLYLSRQKYSLRDNMERKLRPEFYRRDLATGEERRLFSRWDRSGMQVQTMLPRKDGRFFVVASVSYTDNRVYDADFDGADVRELWRTASYPYSFAENEKGELAFHTALYDPADNPDGNYSVCVWDGAGRRRIVSRKGIRYFGPMWSPDGERLVFTELCTEESPAHFFGTVCVCRKDGSDFRRVTEKGAHCFGTCYGWRDEKGEMRDYRGRGSNWVKWTGDGKLVYSKALPGSHPDARYDGTQRNHEELLYDEAAGRGGCSLALLDPDTGEETALTEPREGQWDFRAELRGDGKELLFVRRSFSENAALTALDLGTGETRELTRGRLGTGADYPRYLETEYPLFER